MIWSALFADKVEYVNKGVPILQGKHITSGKIDYKDARYLDKEKYEPIYYPKYVPKANDVFARTNFFSAISFCSIISWISSTAISSKPRFSIEANIL